MEKFHFLLPSVKSMPHPYKLSRRRGSGASTASPWSDSSFFPLASPQPRFPHSRPRRRRLMVEHGHRRSSAVWRVVSCPRGKISATGDFCDATRVFRGATAKNYHATDKKRSATKASNLRPHRFALRSSIGKEAFYLILHVKPSIGRIEVGFNSWQDTQIVVPIFPALPVLPPA